MFCLFSTCKFFVLICLCLFSSFGLAHRPLLNGTYNFSPNIQLQHFSPNSGLFVAYDLFAFERQKNNNYCLPEGPSHE